MRKTRNWKMLKLGKAEIENEKEDCFFKGKVNVSRRTLKVVSQEEIEQMMKELREYAEQQGGLQGFQLFKDLEQSLDFVSIQDTSALDLSKDKKTETIYTVQVAFMRIPDNRKKRFRRIRNFLFKIKFLF